MIKKILFSICIFALTIHQACAFEPPKDFPSDLTTGSSKNASPHRTFADQQCFKLTDIVDINQELHELRRQAVAHLLRIERAACLTALHPFYIKFPSHNTAIICAMDHDHEIGFVALGAKKTTYEIELLRVHKPYQNKGFGSTLLLSAYATICHFARRKNRTTTTIFWLASPLDSMFTNNTLSLGQLVRFYETHGARQVEPRLACGLSEHMSITLKTELP